MCGEHYLELMLSMKYIGSGKFLNSVCAFHKLGYGIAIALLYETPSFSKTTPSLLMRAPFPSLFIAFYHGTANFLPGSHSSI